MRSAHKGLIGAICLIMALSGLNAAYWYGQEQETAYKRDQAHERSALVAHGLIAQRLERIELLLRGVKGYYEGSESVTQEELKHYVGTLRLDQLQVPLQGIAIALRIDHADKDRHTAVMQGKVSDTYWIKPDGVRPQYSPIVLIEPMDAVNAKALGFDIGTNPIALEALQQSLSTRQTVITGSLGLVQDAGENRPAVVMYLPLAAKDGKRVLGWVSGPFRIQDLVEAVAPNMDPDVELVIHDGAVPSPKNIVYGAPPGGARVPEVKVLEVGGRTWTLLIFATSKFEDRFSDVSHWIVAFVGGLASILIGFIYWQLETGRARAIAIALVMTRELRELEVMRQATLDAIPDLLFEVDIHGVVLAYHASRGDLLAAPPEVFMGKNFADVLPAEATAVCMAAIKQAALDGYATGAVYSLPLARGNTWFEMSVSVVPKTEGKAQRFVLLTRDITERKLAEAALQESERLLSESQRIAHIGGWSWALTGTIQWTKETYRLYGVAPETFSPTLEGLANLILPEDRALMQEWTRACVAGERPAELEFHCVWPDGTIRLLCGRGELVNATKNWPSRIIGTVQDITERKQVELALQSSLRDKTALLMEVHHRVKNNLQVISSLLRMEARRGAVPGAVDALKAMQGRIRTMAQLHESLYRSGNFAAVDLGGYLRQIAAQAFRAQLLSNQRVELKLNMGSLQVSMDQAISCGLLVNELVSNCLKHAFPDTRPGEVRVELQPADPETVQKDALWHLRVSDTGVGLSADFEIRRQTSLGLTLVDDLSQQVGGTLTIASQPGTGAEFSLRFKALQPAVLMIPL